jgi:hypothetical protein
MKPRWKRAGNDGEVETTHKGKTWRVRKNYDHNDRHTGEYRIEIKKKNPYDGHDWHWHDTVYGKAHAKSRLPESVQEDAAAVNTGSIPNPAQTAMGPSRLPVHIFRRRVGKEIHMTDRRRRKDKTPVLLKKFRKYMEDNG